MPIATVFQSEDRSHTEIELRREGNTSLIAAYNLFGKVLYYRIEWDESAYHHTNRAETRLDLAVELYNAHAPIPAQPAPTQCHNCGLALNGDGSTPGRDEEPFVHNHRFYCAYCAGRYERD